MLNQETLINSAASFKKDSKRRFDETLASLLALAWRWKDRIVGEFSFEADPELYNEALSICRDLSDKCMEDAKVIAESVANDEYADEWEDAWSQTEEDEYGEMLVARFDMAGSHLIELLDLWIASAFVNGFTQNYTKLSILRYLANPAASGLFKDSGALRWGRGYDRNIADQLAKIGQDAIIGSSRLAEWMGETKRGATYYVRRRGSGYDCDMCESAANVPIPIDQPFEQLHARCCCYPEYHYDSITEQ